jgi:hypothetical protein
MAERLATKITKITKSSKRTIADDFFVAFVASEAAPRLRPARKD